MTWSRWVHSYKRKNKCIIICVMNAHILSKYYYKYYYKYIYLKNILHYRIFKMAPYY